MAFLRPKRTHPPPAWQQPQAAASAVEPPLSDLDPPPPRATPAGTIAALFGLLIVAFTLAGDKPSTMARYAAIGALISLGITVAVDLRAGFRNVIRADIMALAAFYFLTLFEFLFPQEKLDSMMIRETTQTAILTVLVGFAGLLIGRHLIKLQRPPLRNLFTREIPSAWLVVIFWASFLLGYAHMIVAVDFDVFEMLRQMMEPRFTQPWTRGRFGDWKALLVELGMFIYLLPPLAGVALARRHRFGAVQVASLMAGLGFTFFYAFTSGTRNLFAAYLVTFIIGYAFAAPAHKRKQVIVMSCIGGMLLIVATVVMLRFRNIGFTNWVDDAHRFETAIEEESLFVDYNLYAIGALIEVFPKRTPYLGLEVPYLALIRPIPRAIWPGKPEGLSSSIEDALGVEGLTIAASFAGEAYMSGGWPVVFMTGLFFGALAGWWSFLESPQNSELGILIYASGFFAVVISMRSLFVFTTALLPTVAAIVIGSFAIQFAATKAKQWILRPARRPPPPRRPPAIRPRPKR